MKKSLLLVFMFLWTHSAFASCRAGQMTKLTEEMEVSRENKKSGEVSHFLLVPETEVHVIGVKAGKIEVYAVNDIQGNPVSGLAKVAADSAHPVLECQN